MSTKTDIIEVFVQGKPVPQGSLNPMPFKRKNGKLGVNVFQKPELIEWRESIAKVVKENRKGVFFSKETPVKVCLFFRLLRPKSAKRKFPSCKGIDIDKACRSVLDALSEVAYADDCQVVFLSAMKVYVDDEDKQGVFITITGYE